MLSKKDAKSLKVPKNKKFLKKKNKENIVAGSLYGYDSDDYHLGDCSPTRECGFWGDIHPASHGKNHG